ncbi:SDR family NAD(P)-dependent oxidoreductase [Winogradskya humida]|uniref:Short subunit dehydrogenase n=1 Tax=Winogradskya humida TaxID=113566 RepID=A0ABQ3ZX10_9ACTN|nr:SDR family NAD(P)-dependent oxidoreductase [Actinoplanes humidus]GIE23135.1 hypothetical protein Ahu01nite_062370 [Actinoplanes humidus]
MLTCKHVETVENSVQNVLITGGSDGIGLGLAARFQAGGSTVLIAGRSLAKLETAAEAYPGLTTFAGDVGRPESREELAAHVRATMPGLDLLINNAGVQRRTALAADDAPWKQRQAEIDILLAGPGASHGVPVDDFCNTVVRVLATGAAEEIGYGPTGTPEFHARLMAGATAFRESATRFPVAVYG